MEAAPWLDDGDNTGGCMDIITQFSPLQRSLRRAIPIASDRERDSVMAVLHGRIWGYRLPGYRVATGLFGAAVPNGDRHRLPGGCKAVVILTIFRANAALGRREKRA
jgi:hypothetical protein